MVLNRTPLRLKPVEPKPAPQSMLAIDPFENRAIPLVSTIEPEPIPEVTPAQIKQIEAIVAPEFATGNWVDVSAEPIPLPTADLNVLQQFGDTLLTEAAAEPTLDRYLDNSPKNLSNRDYAQMVDILQHQRAAFIAKEAKKREPKEDET